MSSPQPLFPSSTGRPAQAQAPQGQGPAEPLPPDDDGSPPPDDLPACLSCRKRKSKCSRETPSCAQCIRLGCECLYVSKQKPGLKAGVVDTLSRRLEFLERLFLDSTGNKKPHLAFLDLDIDQLRGQLPSPFTPGLGVGGPSSGAGASYLGSNVHLSGAIGEASGGRANGADSSADSPGSQHGRPRSRKRRRLDRNGNEADDDGDDDDTTNQRRRPAIRTQYLFLDDPPYHHHRRRRRTNGADGEENGDISDDTDASTSSLDHTWIPPLPALPLLKAVVEAHFQTVHHWVPILHATRFRAALDDPRERRRRAVLIHAILAMSIKYVDFNTFGLTSRQVARQIRLSRRAVQLNALDGLSFINTQALIFLAFDYMGSGLIAKAWPIVAALTRMVVFLQLNVEPDDASARPAPLVQPGALFDRARDWTEAEERRRIFWCIFFLDRISSISAGWLPSLTATEAHRRLPCSGGFWAREESVTTPYFALWGGRDGEGGGKSKGNMSTAPTNVMTAFHQSPDYYYGSSHHPMSSPVTARDGTTPSGPSATSGGGGSSSASAANTNKLGAVAYCIEATEHLSHVTAFFARQPPPSPSLGETVTAAGAGAGVGAEDRAAMNAWLTRFKELDLRLVHWKMNLPQQWADWHVSLKIDPNLTLCHLSHLASMILLHQHIAYPPPQWSSLVRPSLPSVCSAETCEQAVADMVAISQKYLRYVGGLACGQFAFCLYVAARFILVHGRISRVALPGGGTAASSVPTNSSTTSSAVDETPPSFFALLDSLDNISVRWNGYCVFDDEENGANNNTTNGGNGNDNSAGPSPSEPKPRRQALDLAAQYAARLRSLHQKATAIGADMNTPVSTVDELIALLSTSTMEGLVKVKSSSSSHAADGMMDGTAGPGGAASTSTPSALSSSAASHLRSPSVIHGGGVEIANILQNPVPPGRTPAMTPMPGMTSLGSLASPANGAATSGDNSVNNNIIGGYGGMRGGPVSANVSNVRMMPGTPATATNVFNMDMVAPQHPHHQPTPYQMHQPQHQHQQHPQHHQQHHQQQHPHQQHQQHPHQQQQQPGIDDEDEFAAMSHLLLGDQFLDMERVMMRNDTSFLLR